MELMEFKYRASRRWEKLLMALVWKMPKVVVKWAFVRVAAHATTGPYSDQVMPELLVTDALARWED